MYSSCLLSWLLPHSSAYPPSWIAETPGHLACSFHSPFRDFNCSFPAVPNAAKQLNPELENLKRSKAVEFQVCGVQRLSLCAVGAVVTVFSTQAAHALSPSSSLWDIDIQQGHQSSCCCMILPRTAFWKPLNMELLSVSFLIKNCLTEYEMTCRDLSCWMNGREAL